MGVEAVIAPSFSDIFSGNAFKNGIVTAALAQPEVDRLCEVARNHWIAIDLDAMAVDDDARRPFLLRNGPIQARMSDGEGLDEIALTLSSEAAIGAYELKTGI